MNYPKQINKEISTQEKYCRSRRCLNQYDEGINE